MRKWQINEQPWLVTGWSFYSSGADWTQSHNQTKQVKWQLISATRKRFMVKVSILWGAWSIPEARWGSPSTWDLILWRSRSQPGEIWGWGRRQSYGERLGCRIPWDDSYRGCYSQWFLWSDFPKIVQWCLVTSWQVACVLVVGCGVGVEGWGT